MGIEGNLLRETDDQAIVTHIRLGILSPASTEATL